MVLIRTTRDINLNVHILQHVAFEGPGSIQQWLQARQANVSYSPLYQSNTQLPKPTDFDLIVVMGGPMSVNDETSHPWLSAEKQFIADAMDADIAVLGVCLGAQLIASAQGAAVYAGPEKEIGWWPIQSATPPGDCFQFPASSVVFHWHGETFDLPNNAVRLASSDVCRNQAFQVGKKVIGLQFHLETTDQSAKSIIEHCGDELVSGEKIQTAETMLSNGPRHYEAIHSLMAEVLNYLVRD